MRLRNIEPTLWLPACNWTQRKITQNLMLPCSVAPPVSGLIFPRNGGTDRHRDSLPTCKYVVCKMGACAYLGLAVQLRTSSCTARVPFLTHLSTSLISLSGWDDQFGHLIFFQHGDFSMADLGIYCIDLAGCGIVGKRNAHSARI